MTQPAVQMAKNFCAGTQGERLGTPASSQLVKLTLRRPAVCEIRRDLCSCMVAQTSKKHQQSSRVSHVFCDKDVDQARQAQSVIIQTLADQITKSAAHVFLLASRLLVSAVGEDSQQYLTQVSPRSRAAAHRPRAGRNLYEVALLRAGRSAE